MTWKSNLAETKQHYINWWNHRGIVLNMWEHFQQGVRPHGPYSAEPPIVLTQDAANNFGTGSFNLPGAPTTSDLQQRWFDPQWRAEFLDWYVGHSSFMADMLPVANTQLGPGSMAAILGSVFEGGEDTIWIHPDPNYTDDFRFDPNHPNLLLHKELLRACVERSKGNYYVGMPDLMEGMDVLAAMKGTDKVLMDTLTQPDLLEEQMQRINDAYFQVFDELYDIIRFDGRDCGGPLDPEHRGMTAGTADEMAFCYFSAWAPGKMTKLQSDISTMLSEEDYRRFVQPFIREQAQRIDYTLYHLDGVGALRHLPALLEIEELNAIQWTPGVGQPQGGDPKWYDLYRQIIAGGKSIMACWVTLDQLRPLLDNVGGDGIHLEMDFHSEAEVEQAMRIIEEYQCDEVQKRVEEAIRVGEMKKTPPTPLEGGDQGGDMRLGSSFDSSGILLRAGDKRKALSEVAAEGQRILLLDGGMGTMIQQYDRQEVPSLQRAEGESLCNDYLCLTQPSVIQDIHRRYLAAGSDIIETNTFSAQRISLADYGLEDQVHDINLAAARLARQMADAFTLTDPLKPRFVAGSIGPTNKTCSFSSDGGEPLSYDTLRAAYREQMEALVEGGVDALLIETIFDTLNARAALEAATDVCQQVKAEGGTAPLLMLSFAQVNDAGVNMNGQDVFAFIEEACRDFEVFSVGLNCSSGAAQMAPIIMDLAQRVKCRVSAYPNAGMPNAQGRYEQTGADFARQCWPMLDSHSVSILGGCCGTTDEHIAALRPLVEPAPRCFVTPLVPGASTAPYVRYKRLVPSVPSLARQDNEKESAAVPAATTLGREQNASPATTHDHSDTPPSDPCQALLDAIVAGRQDDALSATKAAIASGADPTSLINNQMICAMAIVGQRFEEGKAFVPQLLMAGRAMKSALGYIKDYQAQQGTGETIQAIGRVVIGTVKGDLHDIGKNLVASMLEGSGFEVINVGIDIEADTFVQAVVDNHADILCLSALLTTTMTYMRTVIDALTAAGIRDKVKVMVGGAPVSQEFADQIGADGYSANANEAVAVAKRLLGKN